MIPYITIKYIIQSLADELEIDIIRAEQPGDAPSYPYGVYKLTSIENESAHQNIRTASGTTVYIHEFSDEVVSLTFLDRNRIDRIRGYSENALQWFKSLSGRAACIASGVTVQLIDNQVQDRSTLIDSLYENRMGFDVRLQYINIYSEAVGKISTVEVTPTYNDIEGETYTITEE